MQKYPKFLHKLSDNKFILKRFFFKFFSLFLFFFFVLIFFFFIFIFY